MKHCMVHEDCGRIGFALLFKSVIGENLKTPKLSPMVYDAITWGIGGLGSLVYIYLCEDVMSNTKLNECK